MFSYRLPIIEFLIQMVLHQMYCGMNPRAAAQHYLRLRIRYSFGMIFFMTPPNLHLAPSRCIELLR